MISAGSETVQQGRLRRHTCASHTQQKISVSVREAEIALLIATLVVLPAR